MLMSIEMTMAEFIRGLPKAELHRGPCVTVNSDDPAYFDGDVLANYLGVQEALGLTRSQLTQLARNSIEASFLAPADKRHWLAAIDAYAAQHAGA